MVYVIYVGGVLLCCSYLVWRVSAKRLLMQRKLIYAAFEKYFFDLQLFLTWWSNLFYHKKKWYEFFFSNKKSFLQEKKYDIATLSEYQKKFIDDALFLQDMFPKNQDIPTFQWPKIKNYRSARFRESLYSLSNLSLTILTLWVWKLLFD
jgi:hypothetical protein